MVRDMVPDAARMKSLAGGGFATATDLADWLVRVLHMPFRDAHHVTGRLVARAEAAGVGLDGLSLADMQAEDPRITQDVFAVLTVDSSVASRTSFGGSAPVRVAAQAARWLALLGCLCLMLSACGKKNAPSPPGPPDLITYPKIYPTHP
jgi:argininosuccinate lyase